MKITKTKDKKYPLKIVLEDGTKITVPKQSAMSNSFLKKHGCSLMAEYVCLQFLGVHKWPINLYKWHKSHTKGDIKSKVTVKGVSKGINKQCKNKGIARYYSKPTFEIMDKAIKANCAVILEQKSPIHTICIIPDQGKDGKVTPYLVNYGKVSKADLKKLIKTATTNQTYRGLVTVARR